MKAVCFCETCIFHVRQHGSKSHRTHGCENRLYTAADGTVSEHSRTVKKDMAFTDCLSEHICDTKLCANMLTMKPSATGETELDLGF